MARSGQSRHAPKRAKQATRSSVAFIGLQNYRRRAAATQRRGRPCRTSGGRRGSVALGHEALGEQRLEALLELGGHRVGDLVGRSRSLRRSEEHTSELQSRGHLVCRLLLEKKKTKVNDHYHLNKKKKKHKNK